MTKEELEKEAEEKYNERLKQNGYKIEYRNGTYIDGYLDSAEPREKRIAELEEKLANADYQLEGRDLEIKELEQQIKEMKGILLCTCEGCSKLPKLYEAFDKEIKENEI